MKLPRDTVALGLAAVCAVLFLALLPTRLQEPVSDTFSSDALHYNQGAIHLLREGTYTVDGVTKFTDREPGQSVFLAMTYAVFGVENRAAIYGLQTLFVLGTLLLLRRELRYLTNNRTTDLFAWLTILQPAVWHIVFSPNREAVALSLAMCIAAALLAYKRTRLAGWALGAGAVTGAAILTYFPLLPVAALLAGLWFVWRLPKAHMLGFVTLAFLPIVLWGFRNEQVLGRFCLARCSTQAIVWHVRGTQARDITGLEPLRCLWAEYISRDWSDRNPACSFNAVKNTQWPDGVHDLQTDLALSATGKQRILAHFGNYAWFSVFEVLEIHLPYVNGWGRAYNALAALGSLVLYAGCACFLWLRIRPWQGWYWLPVLFAGGTVGMFALTDATPRYLLPVIFCYGLAAAIGYDALVSTLLAWRKR